MQVYDPTGAYLFTFDNMGRLTGTTDAPLDTLGMGPGAKADLCNLSSSQPWISITEPLGFDDSTCGRMGWAHFNPTRPLASAMGIAESRKRLAEECAH